MSLGAEDDVKRAVKGIMNRYDFERRDLDPSHLKRLKSLVKKNVERLQMLKELLWKYLRVRNCDQRLCIVLIADYFFQRSHDFRVAVVSDFHKFLINTVEIEPKRCALPGPPAASTLLRRESNTIVNLWIEKFGPGYTQLDRAKMLMLKAETARNAANQEERDRNEARRIVQNERDERMINALQQDYNESAAHFKDSIAQATSILKLLVPHFIDQLSSTNNGTRSSNINLAHIPDGTISIAINKQIIVEKTDDNATVIENFNGLQKLLTKQITRVESWVSKANKHGAQPELSAEIHQLQKQMRDLRNRFSDVKIIEKREVTLPQAVKSNNQMDSDNDFDDDDDDDGFEDVDLRVVDPEDLKLDEAEAIVPLKSIVFDEQPGSSRDDDTQCKTELFKKSPSPIPCSSTSVIPTVSYGLDLAYWGKDVEPAEKVKNQFDGHRFWRPPPDESNKESSDVYNTRIITYVGEMPKITRSCRALLTSGKLCPRMDRFTCPLHGPIVNRDERGKRSDGIPDEAKPLTKAQKARLEAEEDAFYRELEKQTDGKFSYDIAKGKRRGTVAKPKKREKTEAQKTRDRLKSKLFNKRSLRRVTETLEAVQKSKAAQKFGHQFNYM